MNSSLDTGIDIRALLGIPRDHFLVLHVGSHTGAKGHAEAIDIFRKARIKKITFLMVANDLGGGCTKRCKLKKLIFNLRFRLGSGDKKLIISSLPRPQTIAAYKEADPFFIYFKYRVLAPGAFRMHGLKDAFSDYRCGECEGNN